MNQAAIGPPTIVSCFGPVLWAGVAAQALTPHRAGPARGPMDRDRTGLVPCFLVSCFGPSIVRSPLGILYSHLRFLPHAGAATAGRHVASPGLRSHVRPAICHLARYIRVRANANANRPNATDGDATTKNPIELASHHRPRATQHRQLVSP